MLTANFSFSPVKHIVDHSACSDVPHRDLYPRVRKCVVDLVLTQKNGKMEVMSRPESKTSWPASSKICMLFPIKSFQEIPHHRSTRHISSQPVRTLVGSLTRTEFPDCWKSPSSFTVATVLRINVRLTCLVRPSALPAKSIAKYWQTYETQIQEDPEM